MVLGKTSLPRVDEYRPDDPGVLQSFINAHRWTRLNRLREGEGIENEPILGVWNSAIQVHYYQLDAVVRALSMPRVALLLCDGVGLGKTIQCGLVTEELLLRRRIRRVLIICPAMLHHHAADVRNLESPTAVSRPAPLHPRTAPARRRDGPDREVAAWDDLSSFQPVYTLHSG